MILPDATQIRTWSRVNFVEFGYPVAVDPDPDPLQRKVDEAKAELDMLLARAGVTLDYAAIAEDDGMRVLVEKAVQMLTEYDAVSASQDNVETAADFDMIQSLSVGAISETRRGIGSMASVLHPWPALNKLLNGIITLDAGGVLTGLDPRIPVFQSAEDRTDVQYPGADLMYAQRWVDSIYGELRPPGVYRPGWD